MALQRKCPNYCSNEVGTMEWNVQEVKLGLCPKLQNFWMSGLCLNNYWIGNGIIRNMNKLEIYCIGLWNIFPWDWCICMREPFGGLVEFISGYNCGGDFWWDREEGFWNIWMAPMCDNEICGIEIWWGWKGLTTIGKIFWEWETKVKSKTIWFKKTFVNIKSFSDARKHR